MNKLLLEYAQKRDVVVRLKGGDPFVFGRGGEEMPFLTEYGIEVEAIPGVSSATGVPTSAGIPLTFRGISSSFAVITGHEDPREREVQHKLGVFKGHRHIGFSYGSFKEAVDRPKAFGGGKGSKGARSLY